jgi:ubiquinone/menaquinone biosynthesis C-methylase UbiE
MSEPSFTEIAEFYDELMKPVPYRMWVSYYLLLLSMQAVKPKSMLDMCCGTGTMSEFMHKEGFELEGFDLSASMIEQARIKAHRKSLPIRYEVADAAEFDMGRKYDAIFCFFDSLNNIVDEVQFEKALHRAAAHLDPGQSFIFDLNTAYAFRADLFTQQDMSKNSRVKYKWRSDWSERDQIVKVDMRFWVGDQEFHETHVQRAYDIEHVGEMLFRAGFEEVRVFHSYTLDRPRAKSDRIHFACLKG